MIEFIEDVSKNLEELVGFCCQVWSICSSNFREQTLSVDNTLDCPSELKKNKKKNKKTKHKSLNIPYKSLFLFSFLFFLQKK